MTATVSTLRPAPSPQTPAERQRLAAAIDRLAAVQTRVVRVAAAEAKVRELSFDKFREIEAAETALAAARQVEPRRLVSQLLGDDPNPAPAAADLARTLNDAKAAREALAATSEALAAEHRAAKDSLDLAERARDAALSEALRTAPEFRALVADFEHTQRRYGALRGALMRLGRALTDHERGSLNTHHDFLPGDPAPILAPWQAAIEALRTDAAARLPGDAPNPKDAA